MYRAEFNLLVYQDAYERVLCYSKLLVIRSALLIKLLDNRFRTVN